MIQITSCQWTNDDTDLCLLVYYLEDRFLLVNEEMMIQISACLLTNDDTSTDSAFTFSTSSCPQGQ